MTRDSACLGLRADPLVTRAGRNPVIELGDATSAVICTSRSGDHIGRNVWAAPTQGAEVKKHLNKL